MGEGTAGQAINLMSNDVSRFDWLMSFTHDIWRSPLGSLIATYFIFTQVSYSGLIGMGILVLFMPFQAFLGKKSANVRLKTAQRTDKRVESMYSIINGIQVIKMFGWEKAFERVIEAIRRHEGEAIARGYYIKATLFSFEFLSNFAVFATLVSYVYMGNSITAQKAFVTIAYFNYVNTTLVHFWPMAITSVADGWISLRRVEAFLVQEVPEHQENQPTKGSSIKPGIVLKNASAFWNKDEQNNNGIESISMEINEPGLTALVGHVGCGKTTLLETILREIPLKSGSVDVRGTVSYAAQQAWIFEGSIKRNIIFVEEEFDEKRYKQVVHICALEKDFEKLSHGDETIVGERGISLSGGQKARINLARAVYKKADIYLLDDILSAVDAHVGKHIFEKCIEQFLSVSFFFFQSLKGNFLELLI